LCLSGVLTVKPDQKKDDTHLLYFMASGLLNVLSIWSSTKALESVSYPTQVIAKSAKPVPIIIMCRLFRMKVYPIYKYFFVLVISIGVGLAIYKGNKSSESMFDEKHIWGIALLLFSLLMDGALAVVEEQLCATTAPSPLKMMAMLNGWSVVYLAVALSALSSEAIRFYEFVQRFPMVLAFLGGLAICGTAGQVFIFVMISLFGTLPCAIVTTVRKVFSTVYSAVRNGKTFDVRNWCGVALVFGAFFGELIYQKTVPSEEL
jgi:solute carrier family 35 (UDP-galactose transporter), member B1